MKAAEAATPPTEFLTLAQTAKKYPAFTESALRWLRFNGHSNGFNNCIRKIGRKLLIDTAAFEEWIARHQAD